MTRISTAQSQRHRITVRGTVQGVGFRPFVHQVAGDLALGGWVKNVGSTVLIEVEGQPSGLHSFREMLENHPPRLANVDQISTVQLDAVGYRGFEILRSEKSLDEKVLVTPDAAACADCLAEIADPAARRYGYAFTNCTNCGPRFTIVADIPYDRINTTMAPFSMCADCQAEYHDPNDRRFHAQPICCPACGPTLSLVKASRQSLGGNALQEAATLLRDNKVVAIKGLGGFHLAVLANSELAVNRLRARKHREDKPFAVMVCDLEAAQALCEVSDTEAALLSSPARPIVLLSRRANAGIASGVAPLTSDLGLILPYTPLHSLLLDAVGGPIVLTSGNVSDEPIAFHDQEAEEQLGGIADAFLTHNRGIRTRTDDSVVRVVAGSAMTVRRSRGYVPNPIQLPVEARRPILACGAELKNTITFARGNQALLSHHIGDLKNLETYNSFLGAVEHFERLFGIIPEVVAHDLHPGYLSTSFAQELSGVDLVAVQHHHAHIGACMVDNDHSDPVIGVAFDGLGYGSDGTMWGGEFLVADLLDFERMAWFEPVPLLGGDAVMSEPWRMAAAYLDLLGEAESPDVEVALRQPRWNDVVRLASSDLAGPPTSSVGRLFDAIAALVGVRDVVNYEGQAAVELEQIVDPHETDAYSARFDGNNTFTVRGSDFVASALADLRGGVDKRRIAARFHRGLAETVVAACDRVRETGGPQTVALSGGVFLNKVLLEHVIAGLEEKQFHVLSHRRVPPNDGCISLGQAAVAAARD